LIELLNEIRFGEISPTGLAMLQELEKEPKYPADGIKAIKLYATNEEVSKINSVELAKLPYRLRCYQAIDWEVSVKRLPELLRNCLAPDELQLKLGAQVMLIKNLSSQLVNGSQGVIVDFRESECKVDYYGRESRKGKILVQTLSLPVVRFTNGIKRVIELAE
jgi:ATP-dependent DNA helicase PIF1